MTAKIAGRVSSGMQQLELQDLSAGYGLEEVIHKINLKAN